MVKEAKRISEAKSNKQVQSYVDTVQLGVDGWRMRYYNSKFLLKTEAEYEEFT